MGRCLTLAVLPLAFVGRRHMPLVVEGCRLLRSSMHRPQMAVRVGILNLQRDMLDSKTFLEMRCDLCEEVVVNGGPRLH